MTSDNLERVARAILDATSTLGPIPDSTWELALKSHRELVAEYPIYEQGSTMVGGAMKRARAAIAAYNEALSAIPVPSPMGEERVAKADREAAWPFAPKCYHRDPNPGTRDRWMAGQYDDSARVLKAFAEHRIRAIQAAVAEAVQEAGACLSAPGSSPVGTEAPAGLRPSGDDPSREWQEERRAMLVKIDALQHRAVEAEHRLLSFRQHRAARSAQINEFIKARAPELWDDFACVSVNGSVYSDGFTMEPTLEREMNALRWRVEEAETEATKLRAALADRDSDGSPKGRDAQRLDGEAATARAEGIAQEPKTPSVRKGVA